MHLLTRARVDPWQRPLHGPRPRFPLLRPRPQEIRPLPHVGSSILKRSRNHPMVLLGLLPRLLIHRDKRLHRQPTPHRPPRRLGRAQSRFAPHPRASL